MPSFRPISEEQAQKERNSFEPVKPGVYDFEVVEAKLVHNRSKNDGSQQIEMIIQLYGADGERCGRVWDYLQFDGKMAWKLRHAMYAIGLGSDYEAGDADPDVFVNRSGKADIDFKPASGDYKAKNTVKDYIVPEQPEKKDDGFPF